MASIIFLCGSVIAELKVYSLFFSLENSRFGWKTPKVFSGRCHGSVICQECFDRYGRTLILKGCHPALCYPTLCPWDLELYTQDPKKLLAVLYTTLRLWMQLQSHWEGNKCKPMKKDALMQNPGGKCLSDRKQSLLFPKAVAWLCLWQSPYTV